MQATEIVQAIKNGKLSAVNHLNDCFEKIEENKCLNIFLNTFPEKTRLKAV